MPKIFPYRCWALRASRHMLMDISLKRSFLPVGAWMDPFRSVTHDWMGLGPSLKATKRPRSSALLLGWLLLSIHSPSLTHSLRRWLSLLQRYHVPSRGVRVAPIALFSRHPWRNAASLASGSTSKSPDLTQLLPPTYLTELLCTFIYYYLPRKSVMETLSMYVHLVGPNLAAETPRPGRVVSSPPQSIGRGCVCRCTRR